MDYRHRKTCIKCDIFSIFAKNARTQHKTFPSLPPGKWDDCARRRTTNGCRTSRVCRNNVNTTVLAKKNYQMRKRLSGTSCIYTYKVLAADAARSIKRLVGRVVRGVWTALTQIARKNQLPNATHTSRSLKK